MMFRPLIHWKKVQQVGRVGGSDKNGMPNFSFCPPSPTFYFAPPPLQEVIHTISMCANEIDFVLASGVKESYLV